MSTNGSGSESPGPSKPSTGPPDSPRAPQLSTSLRSLPQTASLQLPPSPSLWGLGGGTEITGRGCPTARGLTPKQLWGPCRPFVSLTHSLSRVEPKVRVYCTSRKIPIAQSSPDTSPVKGLWALPAISTEVFTTRWLKRSELGQEMLLAPREPAANWPRGWEPPGLRRHEPSRGPVALSLAAQSQVSPAKE